MEEGFCITVPVTAAGSQAAIPAGSFYCGFVASAGAAGSIEVRDGAATGPLLDAIAFAAAGQAQTFYGPAPLYCNGKVWVVLVSGALPAGFSLRYR